MRSIVIAAILVVVSLASAGCRSTTGGTATPTLAQSQPGGSHAQSLAAGDYTFSLDHGGRTRSYIVHVPPAVAALAPLLVALHGGGGTGAAFQEQNGLDEIADREGFLVVYPEGTGVLPNRLHTWNSGDTCCGYAFDRNVDDVDFLRSVLADLAGRTEIDPGRVYFTGHSNGAMMAYRFAVEAPGLVAAIAPIGGAADLAEPRPPTPIPLLHIHSADDPRALYQGGEGPPFPGTNRTVHHEPVLPMIETWAAANGCASAAQLVETATGSGANDGQRVERFVWAECAQDAPVEHIVLHGSGHGWPGVEESRAVQRHVGPPTTIISASEEVWAFVSQFER